MDTSSGNCFVCEKTSRVLCSQCKLIVCSPNCVTSHISWCNEFVYRRDVLKKLCEVPTANEDQEMILDTLKRLYSQGEEETEIMEEGSKSFPSLKGVQEMIHGLEQTNLEVPCSKREARFKTMINPEMSSGPWWLKTKDDYPVGPKERLPTIRQLREGGETYDTQNLEAFIIDIIFSYCFSIRLHEGWESDCLAAMASTTLVSSVLGEGGLPVTVLGALSNCLNRTCIPGFEDDGSIDSLKRLLKDDVVWILKLGRAAIVSLLSDLQSMLEAVKGDIGFEYVGESKRVEIETEFNYHKKNVWFLMCWADEQANETWDRLALVVKGEENDIDD